MSALMRPPLRFIRWYTTANTGRSLKGSRPTMSLEHFIQRSKALSLWREILRALKVVPRSHRSEMIKFARDEFQSQRQVTDLAHIRYLISSGRTQFESMRRYIDEQAA